MQRSCHHRKKVLAGQVLHLCTASRMSEKECPEIQNHAKFPTTSENCKILHLQLNNLETLGPVLVWEQPILQWDLPYLLAYQYLNGDGATQKSPEQIFHLPSQARLYLQSTVCESQILGPLKKHEETWKNKSRLGLQTFGTMKWNYCHIPQNLEGWLNLCLSYLLYITF